MRRRSVIGGDPWSLDAGRCRLSDHELITGAAGTRRDDRYQSPQRRGTIRDQEGPAGTYAVELPTRSLVSQSFGTAKRSFPSEIR